MNHLARAFSCLELDPDAVSIVLESPESGGSVSKSLASCGASPRTVLKSPILKAVKTNSPARFTKPTKPGGAKARRRSSKYHTHTGRKKLLNTSATTNILTPSKQFVAPMARRSLRSSNSRSKIRNTVKPALSMKDENSQPDKIGESL